VRCFSVHIESATVFPQLKNMGTDLEDT